MCARVRRAQGCVLKNTKWIIALVVFTGKETKLMMQNKGTLLALLQSSRSVCPPALVLSVSPVPFSASTLSMLWCSLFFRRRSCALSRASPVDLLPTLCFCPCGCAEKKLKRSQVDRTVDRALYVIFAMQAVLCIFGSVAYSIWLHTNASKHWYLPFNISKIDVDGEAGVAFLTYLVLVDLLVPISLYVSMELVKATQAWFINQDVQMYYDVNDLPARARTSNLNEEMGQVREPLACCAGRCSSVGVSVAVVAATTCSAASASDGCMPVCICACVSACVWSL